jgi:circadian clock protein KaiB
MSWPAAPAPEPFTLRLFVSGASTRSQRAISNIRAICDAHLRGRFELEIVDVYLDPDSTRDFQIVATPTLVRVRPAPVRRVIGDLSDHARVMNSLGILSDGGQLEAQT